MKKCSKCKEDKKIEKFSTYRLKNGDIKPKSACKACYVKSNTALRSTPEGYKKLREYRTSDRGKEVASRANKKFRKSEKFEIWWEKNKGRYACQIFARNASREKISNNGIHRDKCEVCGSSEELHAHHEDYQNPFDVVILCNKHHAELHVNLEKIK